MASPYDLGAAVAPGDISLSLTDGSGTPANPSPAPVLTITLPDRSTATPAVTAASTGKWQLSAAWVTTQAGHHTWAWTWTGTFLAVTEATDSFEVRESPDPTIIALSEAREILKIPAGDTSRDSDIRGYSKAVTEWVEYTCGPVVTRQVTEVVRAQGRVMVLGRAPVRTDLGTALDPSNRRDGSTTNGLVSITPELSYGFMYPLAELLVHGEEGIVRHLAGLPFFYSGDPYAQFIVTYWAGRKVIPWGITEASKITLKHIWAVERGSAGSGAAGYGESETVATGFGFAVPNRAVQLLAPHSGQASRAAFA